MPEPPETMPEGSTGELPVKRRRRTKTPPPSAVGGDRSAGGSAMPEVPADGEEVTTFVNLCPAVGGEEEDYLVDPMIATLHPNRRVVEVFSQIDDLEVGVAVAPVRKFGPRMLAPRVENPE
eukprot:3763636-Alexandrium_andersonii.AAC.1